jgi:hypothetical protein
VRGGDFSEHSRKPWSTAAHDAHCVDLGWGKGASRSRGPAHLVADA